MKRVKLLDGLRMLGKVEWLSFRKYMLMYCTKSSDNYRLLDYLFLSRNELTEMSDVKAIKKLLFDKMTDKGFSNLMSRIFNWFEEWLIWYENKKDKVTSDIQLVKIYNRKGVFNLADKTYKRVEKILLDEKRLSLRKHRDLYDLHHNHYYSDNPVKYQRKEEILNSLVSYFLLQFKEQSCLYLAELHNWGIIQNHDYTKEIELLNKVGVLISDSQTSQVINYIVLMVSELDEKAFWNLQKMIYSDKLKPDSELYMLSSLYLITFSLRLWNNNKITDPQAVIDTYDFGLESGVLLNTGKIPIIRFINFVTTLGFIKASKTTYDFVDKWIHLVDTNDHDAIKALSYAQLKFIEKKYQDIVPLLLGKKYDTDFGKLRAISLELISLYYDRKTNYGLLHNRINNFKRVLRTFSSRKSEFTYHGYLNFTKVLELLIKRDFIKISINIDKYSPLLYKKWLNSEIEVR